MKAAIAFKHTKHMAFTEKHGTRRQHMKFLRFNEKLEKKVKSMRET